MGTPNSALRHLDCGVDIRDTDRFCSFCNSILPRLIKFRWLFKDVRNHTCRERACPELGKPVVFLACSLLEFIDKEIEFL